jgi:hypothetical protein
LKFTCFRFKVTEERVLLLHLRHLVITLTPSETGNMADVGVALMVDGDSVLKY